MECKKGRASQEFGRQFGKKSSPMEPGTANCLLPTNTWKKRGKESKRNQDLLKSFKREQDKTFWQAAIAARGARKGCRETQGKGKPKEKGGYF